MDVVGYVCVSSVMFFVGLAIGLLSKMTVTNRYECEYECDEQLTEAEWDTLSEWTEDRVDSCGGFVWDDKTNSVLKKVIGIDEDFDCVGDDRDNL